MLGNIYNYFKSEINSFFSETVASAVRDRMPGMPNTTRWMPGMPGMPNTTGWMPGMPGMPNTTGWMPSWRSANPDPNMTANATANMTANATANTTGNLSDSFPTTAPTGAPTLSDVVTGVGNMIPAITLPTLRGLRSSNTEPVVNLETHGDECPAEENEVEILQEPTPPTPGEYFTPPEEPTITPPEEQEERGRIDRLKTFFGMNGGKTRNKRRRRGKKSKRKRNKAKTRRRKRRFRKKTRKY